MACHQYGTHVGWLLWAEINMSPLKMNFMGAKNGHVMTSGLDSRWVPFHLPNFRNDSKLVLNVFLGQSLGSATRTSTSSAQMRCAV
jgi:hypothetical protein